MPGLSIQLRTPGGSLKAAPEAARWAEDHGFDGVYATEGGNDSLAWCMVAALATKRIKVGTNIANIYLRNPQLAANAANAVNDMSGGRMVLGLGISHAPMNTSAGIEMGPPIPTMRDYIQRLRPNLKGSPPPPVYLAALRSGMGRLSGEIADGVMYLMIPLKCLPEAVKAVREGEKKRTDSKRTSVALTIGIAVADDLAIARQAGRQGIAGFLNLEYYRNALASWGYGEVVERVRQANDRKDQQGAFAAISNDLVDELFVVGPKKRCQERLELFRAAGVDTIILSARNSGEQDSGFRSTVLAMGS